MAGAKKVKITKVVEETRRETFQRGVKQGSAKSMIDKGVDKVATPASDQLTQMVNKIFPGADMADPAIKSLVEFMILNGAAEIVAVSSGAVGTLASKVPGLKNVDPEKLTGLARYLRGYSGEKVGNKTADTVFDMVPKLVSMISNPAVMDLLKDASDAAPVPRLTEGAKLPTLTDED